MSQALPARLQPKRIRHLPSLGVDPSAFAQVAQPHTAILSASARSRSFLMMTVANVTSAAAAITIHKRDLICIPPRTGRAEGVNSMLRLFAIFLMLSCSGPLKISTGIPDLDPLLVCIVRRSCHRHNEICH